MSSEGTKVTTDPRSQNEPKNENPGMVTSDSLAAESIRDGGSFAANSDFRGPMSQPSSSTTSNVTDVSGARELAPAPDAEARAASEAWSESAQLNAGIGLGKDAGRGPTWAAGASSKEGTSDFREITHTAQPKGKDLTEGRFDPDAPNASYSTAIGTNKDPGRVALGQIETSNTPYAGGAGPRDGQISNDGQFDILKDASA